eukprot:364676-Chlamydomonas_euryale.AAC.1
MRRRQVGREDLSPQLRRARTSQAGRQGVSYVRCGPARNRVLRNSQGGEGASNPRCALCGCFLGCVTLADARLVSSGAEPTEEGAGRGGHAACGDKVQVRGGGAPPTGVAAAHLDAPRQGTSCWCGYTLDAPRCAPRASDQSREQLQRRPHYLVSAYRSRVCKHCCGRSGNSHVPTNGQVQGRPWE